MQTKSRDEEMLCKIYKDCKMGVESMSKLLPDISSQDMKNAMAAQLQSYQTFAARASELLAKQGKAPEDAGFFEKLPAEVGMAVSRATDRSDSKTAELMINGYVMGVTELKKQLADVSGVSEQTSTLANDLLQFQLGGICDMKRFL
ncbi:MAG: hypothetical protein II135_05105 [Clostridia bacterium]|nr:hypothetical protein [Clostridia bacterium]MBQ3869487.1 hypothetical protein [Clostridia bacterium]